MKKNPNFTFNCTDTEILVLIATGKIDAKAMAWKTLADHGLNENGEWIGFAEAEKIFEEKVIYNIEGI